MKTRRHRFVGQMGQLCSAEGETYNSFCGLNYSASLHYNDDDHPFNAGEPAGASCGWVMQNVPLAVGGNTYCWRMAEDPVHLHDRVAEPTVPVPVMDVPLEDGMPWYSVGASPVGPPVPTPSQEHVPDEPGSMAVRAAAALRRGDVVVDGPWQVRQFYWGTNGLETAAFTTLAALAEVGEEFVAESFWDGERMFLRITWGVMLGVDPEQVCTMIESWST